jgi:ribonuclease BN (tRNA processing enzyme)
MTSFLIDGQLAVDAGAVSRVLSIEEQRQVRHILISHSHMDHIASLPFLIENSFANGDAAVNIYCTKRVLANVRRHMFNNDTWPDFSRIPNHMYPSVRFVEIEPEQPFEIAGLGSGPVEVTAIPVNHIVPTVGFLIRQGSGTVLFTSDTGPTDRVWEVANHTKGLGALITECSFPTDMQNIADISLHLTPTSLAGELAKVRPEIPVLLYHFKPPYIDQLRAEIGGMEFAQHLEELEQGKTYQF